MRAIWNVEMTKHHGRATHRAASTYAGTACNTYAASHRGVFAHSDIVSDLDLIIQFYAKTNQGVV